MRTVAEVRRELHELFLKYSGEGYPYNETEINMLLDELQRATLVEYWMS